MKKPCDGCGEDFNDLGNASAVFCVACEIKIRAVEPSQSLKDMRYISEGGQAVTAQQQRFVRMIAKDEFKFQAALDKAEGEYRKGIKADSPAETNAVEPDPQSERVEKMIEELLANMEEK